MGYGLGGVRRAHAAVRSNQVWERDYNYSIVYTGTWSGRKPLIFGPTDKKQSLTQTYPNPSGAAGVAGALVYLVLRFVISAQATLLMQTFSVTDLLLCPRLGLEPDGVLTNERIFA